MSTHDEQVRALFFEAVDRPEEAAALLDAADPAVAAEVRSLLGHHDDAPLVASQSLDLDAATARLETVPELQGSRYRALSRLGRGGFGDVVRVFDRRLRRVVASKQARPELEELDHLLTEEARLLAYLDHPGVVPVYDVQPGTGYTMKVLTGGSLKERLATLRAEGAKMPVGEAVRILSRVAETLANAHSKGVLHLDVKPANVMLEPFGHVGLIDWGIARFFDHERYAAFLRDAGEAVDEPAADDVVAGTPVYMPPEQFVPDRAALTPAADVYAAGCLLFEALSGERPFPSGTDPTVLLVRKGSEDPRDVRELRPDVPARLADLCTRMRARRPEHRPQGFDEVLAELASLADVGGGAPSQVLEAGETLFSEGDAGGVAYWIEAGALEVVVWRNGQHEPIAVRRAGETIGELSVLSKTPRSATVVASERTVVRALDWAGLEAELGKVNPMIGRLLRSLSDRLVEATEQG